MTTFKPQATTLETHVTRLVYVWPLLFVPLYVLVRGYLFGLTDDGLTLHLAFLKVTLNPALYPGDPMIGTFAAYPGYYFQGLALAAARFGIAPVYAALHVLTLGAYFSALARLTRRLLGETGLLRPLLVVLLLTLGTLPTLSGDDLILRTAMSRHVAMAAGLWALTLGLEGKRLPAYVLAGLLMDVHPIGGGLALALLAGGDLAAQPRQRWPEIGLAVALACFLGAPVLLQSLAGSEPATAEWIALLRMRSAQHAFPLSWPLTDYLAYGLLMLIAGLAWWPLRRQWVGRWLAGAALAALVLCLVGLVFSEIVPVGLILRLQLFRSSKLLTLLALPLVASRLLAAWDRGGPSRAGSLLAFLGMFSPLPLLWVVLVGSGLLLTLVGTREAAQRAAAFFAGRITRGLGPWFARSLAFWKGRSEGLRWSLATLLFVLVVASAANLARVAPNPQGLAAWEDVQQWAKSNTPLDTTFLTPPYYFGFRVDSERPVVGEWKDGTQQFFSVPFAAVWWARMQDLHTSEDAWYGYDDLSQTEVERLGQKYGAGYAVFPAAGQLDLPVAYRNGWFVVYRLR